MNVEAVAAVADQAGAVEEVVNDHRLEDIQLEVAGRAADIDGHVIPEYLSGDHREGFALRWVHLPGHDGRSGLVIRDMDFTDAAAWAGGEHPDIVGDLHQADGNGLERAVGLHDGVVCGERFELVGRGDEGETGKGGDLSRHVFRISRRSIDPGPDGGAAKRQLGKMGERIADGSETVVQLAYIAAEFLTDGQRRGVHE